MGSISHQAVIQFCCGCCEEKASICKWGGWESIDGLVSSSPTFLEQPPRRGKSIDKWQFLGYSRGFSMTGIQAELVARPKTVGGTTFPSHRESPWQMEKKTHSRYLNIGRWLFIINQFNLWYLCMHWRCSDSLNGVCVHDGMNDSRTEANTCTAWRTNTRRRSHSHTSQHQTVLGWPTLG